MRSSTQPSRSTRRMASRTFGMRHYRKSAALAGTRASGYHRMTRGETRSVSSAGGTDHDGHEHAPPDPGSDSGVDAEPLELGPLGRRRSARHAEPGHAREDE